MPRLSGNSRHGSNPMTWLSRTFNWIPHCWPQKQQCVFTSRSGSVLVDRRMPVMADRCGPNRSVILRSSTGMVAMRPLRLRCRDAIGQVLAPERALREAEERAATARADLLVVLRAAARVHLVRE